LALHKQLYDAFGWDAPQFAHLPLIMKPVGKGKLSKRDGEKLGFPVFPLSWNESVGYKEEGYFPEAVINFLALLGWNPGTEQELFSLDELVEAFTLERVNKSGARFDPEKTKWYNQYYLQQAADIDLAKSYLPTVKEHTTNEVYSNLDYVTKVVTLIKERAVFVSDFWELSDYFFLAPVAYNEKAAKKQWKEDTADIMNDLISIVEPIEDFSSENTESIVKAWIADKDLSFGKVMPPLRLFLVGDMKGPHIFDIMAMIGKEESITRIKTALNKLG
jgi:glutamyl-tRNA synthetase